MNVCEPATLSVEFAGAFVSVRCKGRIDEATLHSCQSQVVALLHQSGCRRILYDAYEMDNPPLEIALLQKQLSEQFQSLGPIRVALLVPNSRLAFLSRIAFGPTLMGVFYRATEALAWLTEE